MRPQFDQRDQTILDQRQHAWNQRTGARVGDFVTFPDGSLHRFTHDWGDGLQTAPARSGSYYLGLGYISYSGGLDPSVRRDRLAMTPEMTDGHVWFFHHDWARADNGVYCTIPCRVFQVMP